MKVPNCGACATCGEVPIFYNVREHTKASAETRWFATVGCLTHDRGFEAAGPTIDEAVRKATAIWADGRHIVMPA